MNKKINSILAISIIILIAGILGTLIWVIKREETPSTSMTNLISQSTITPGVSSQCASINLVKLITVTPDSITIEFDSDSGGFQMVGREDPSGETELFDYGTIFTVREGDNIYWGDGDHAFNFLTVKDINDPIADLEIKETFRFPGAEDKETIMNCQVIGKFDSVDQSGTTHNSASEQTELNQ